jgi:hypothetical protein
LDPAFVTLLREIAARTARILDRGTQVGSYNDSRALPDDGAA